MELCQDSKLELAIPKTEIKAKFCGVERCGVKKVFASMKMRQSLRHRVELVDAFGRMGQKVLC